MLVVLHNNVFGQLIRMVVYELLPLRLRVGMALGPNDGILGMVGVLHGRVALGTLGRSFGKAARVLRVARLA